MAVTADGTSALPVTTTTGSSGVVCRMCISRSMPETPGMYRSVSTQSISLTCFSSSCMASAPELAQMDLKPKAASSARTARSDCSSSSTISTVPVERCVAIRPHQRAALAWVKGAPGRIDSPGSAAPAPSTRASARKPRFLGKSARHGAWHAGCTSALSRPAGMISTLPSSANEPLIFLRFRPAWAYIVGVREFCRFFCEATYRQQDIAERARLVLQETLENAVKYSTPGQQYEARPFGDDLL